ncbi:MAG TPA: HIT domain-containing protein [Patescibacteria group bacterium]|jgi:histidine triad (HIT) family protein|nr:HIT domain-containing protein [Patescibacteria group bacterium]
MVDSIFTRIIKGELPCYKIYEDQLTIAFLDLHPIQPGHTLVVPKKQIDQLWDLSDEDYLHLMGVTKKIALRLRQEFKVSRVGVQVIGIHVPHAHIQLIPFNTVEEFTTEQDMDAPVDADSLSELAKRVALN